MFGSFTDHWLGIMSDVKIVWAYAFLWFDNVHLKLLICPSILDSH